MVVAAAVPRRQAARAERREGGGVLQWGLGCVAAPSPLQGPERFLGCGGPLPLPGCRKAGRGAVQSVAKLMPAWPPRTTPRVRVPLHDRRRGGRARRAVPVHPCARRH
jgi:hypothetical protein